jgi:hypothetical protein
LKSIAFFKKIIRKAKLFMENNDMSGINITHYQSQSSAALLARTEDGSNSNMESYGKTLDSLRNAIQTNILDKAKISGPEVERIKQERNFNSNHSRTEKLFFQQINNRTLH